MGPEKVRDCFNNHLLNNSLKKAVALTYKEIFTETYESLDLKLNEKKDKTIRDIIEALSQTSYIPKTKEEISILSDPEDFRAINLIYCKTISFLEFISENHDAINEAEVKKIWNRKRIKALLEAYREVYESSKNFFIEGGVIPIPSSSSNALIQLLYSGFRVLLGEKISQQIADQVNPSLDILRPLIDQIVLVWNQTPSGKSN